MNRIDTRTVELTDDEITASEYVDFLTGEGVSLQSAVKRARYMWPEIEDLFWFYLLGEK